MPDSHALTWLPGWTEESSQVIGDIVSCVLWIREPMYRAASASVRRCMEKDEAAALLHASETAWKTHHGRGRGWVRKHLEEDLRLRAGGGDPAPDAWEAVRTQRRAALLMDYVCVFRGLRVALWWSDQRTVSVFGIGDRVVNLHATAGRIMVGPGSVGWSVPAATWAATVLGAAPSISWAPGANTPSVGAMTVAQIQDLLVALDPAANKTGGRAGLWNRLLWVRFMRSLQGLEEPVLSRSQSLTSLSAGGASP
jgi:hypothetical protein